MQEFSSISVSTYEPDGLTGLLNEQAAAGWSVVAIVPTGSTVTAYLARETDAADAGTAEADAAPIVAAATAEEPAPEAPEAAALAATAAAGSMADEPAAEAAPVAAQSAEPMLPGAAPAPEPAAEPAPEPAAQTAAAAPAGWYADPSGRFELRYWDGGTWTEHVSRAGQQYTDPPVA